MPKFDITIKQMVEIFGEITVSAKDEDAAREKVQEMIDDGKLGELDWSVAGGTTKHDFGWDAPDGVLIEIEEVNEQ